MADPLPRPIPHIPFGWQIAIKGSLHGLPVENTFHMCGTSLVSAPTASEVAVHVAGAWIPFATAVMHVDYSVPQIGVYDLSESESVEFISTPTIPGGKAGAPATAGVAALLTHHTAIRKKRGLTYLGALPFSSVDTANSSTLTTDAFTAINAAWAAFLSDLEDVSFWGSTNTTLQVLSYVTNKVSNIRMIPVTSTGLAHNLSSLRKRRARK